MRKDYKYKWSRSFSVPAQIFGDFYYGLAKRSPEALVEAAKKKSSPVHSLFEWNDKKAAREQRLILARVMINSLQVEIITPKGKPGQVVAFVRSSNRGRHVATLEATSEELTAAMQNCWRDMVRFRNQYKDLEIASTVIAAINEVDRNLRRRKAA